MYSSLLASKSCCPSMVAGTESLMPSPPPCTCPSIFPVTLSYSPSRTSVIRSFNASSPYSLTNIANAIDACSLAIFPFKAFTAFTIIFFSLTSGMFICSFGMSGMSPPFAKVAMPPLDNIVGFT